MSTENPIPPPAEPAGTPRAEVPQTPPPQMPDRPPPDQYPPGRQPVAPAPQAPPPAYVTGYPQAAVGPPGGYRPPPGGPPPMGPVAPVPPLPRRSSAWTACLVIAIIVVVGFIGLIAMFFFIAKQAGTPQTTWAGTSGQTVGVVKVTGVIMGGGGSASIFGVGAGSDSIVNQIRGAAKDNSIKALIIRIDSPGGSAAASQEIYQAIEQYREKTKRPVVASMGDVAASGGYYVASAADKIMAAPATLTGSIGVIFEFFEVDGLMGRFGVKSNTMTAGRYKDMGSMFRAMRPDERRLFQTMLDDVHDQFIDAVAKGRKMKVQDVRKLADGRVFTGRQALEVKLVDANGTFRDAIGLAGKLANIPGEPTVRFLQRITPFSALFGEMDSTSRAVVPPGLLFDQRLWPVVDPRLTTPMPRLTAAVGEP